MMERIGMRWDIPESAKRRVGPGDDAFSEVRRGYAEGRAEIRLPDRKVLRAWARSQRWPTPLFGFTEAFLATMFENAQAFDLALGESGVEVHMPVQEHTLTRLALEELDTLYDAREQSGLGERPTDWGSLVSRLRAVRRLVEAGVKVHVEGTQTILDSWEGFYSWAHQRYPMLEDGFDSWIGDDKS